MPFLVTHDASIDYDVCGKGPPALDQRASLWTLGLVQADPHAFTPHSHYNF